MVYRLQAVGATHTAPECAAPRGSRLRRMARCRRYPCWHRTMATRIIVAAAAALVVVVGIVRAPGRDLRLVGTWALVPELVAPSPRPPGAGAEEQAALRSVLEQARIEVTFTAERMRFVSRIKGKETDREEGYRIARVEGNKIFVEFERAGRWEQETLELYGSTLWIRAGGIRVALKRHDPTAAKAP